LPDKLTAPIDRFVADDLRSAKRQVVLKSAKIVFNEAIIDCVVVNLSEEGVRVRTNMLTPVPDRVTLRLHGGATFSAVRRWARGKEIGFSLEGHASLPEEEARMAWRIYEMVHATTIAEPVELLRARRFYDDLTLQKAAEEAEVGLRRLEAALAAWAQKP
jgi:hypothetical protein